MVIRQKIFEHALSSNLPFSSKSLFSNFSHSNNSIKTEKHSCFSTIFLISLICFSNSFTKLLWLDAFSYSTGIVPSAASVKPPPFGQHERCSGFQGFSPSIAFSYAVVVWWTYLFWNTFLPQLHHIPLAYIWLLDLWFIFAFSVAG